MQHLLRYSASAVSLSVHHPSSPPSLSLSHLALSFSFLLLLLLPLAPLSRTFSLSHVFSFHLSTNLSSPSLSPPPSPACSFVVRCSLQVRANPPSYIQQTPSIYSFELDGSKGKVAGCCSVNFRPLKYLVSSLPPSLPRTLCLYPLFFRVNLSLRKTKGRWRSGAGEEKPMTKRYETDEAKETKREKGRKRERELEERSFGG